MSFRLLEQSDPIARKPHRCIWCGERIEKGDVYRREKSVYDGEMQNLAWHPECAEARYAGLECDDDTEFTPYSAERPRSNSDNNQSSAMGANGGGA